MIDLLDKHKLNDDNKIDCLDHGFVRLVDVMPRVTPSDDITTGDFSIVQAARVSYGNGTKRVNEDTGLIRYLMRHRHSTPFEMAEVKFHCKLPIFVARQWIRHRTACLSGDMVITYDELNTIQSNLLNGKSIKVKDLYNKINHKVTSTHKKRIKPMYEDVVDENKLYPIRDLAKIVHRSPQTFKKQLLENKTYKFSLTKKNGKYYLEGRQWKEYANKVKNNIYTLSFDVSERYKSLNIRSMDEDTGDMCYTNVTDIWESGIKDIYRYTFSNGNYIDCTKDHLVNTNKGWLKISEFENDTSLEILYFGVSKQTIPKKVEFSDDEISSEVWKEIPGFGGMYEVSNLGRIKSNSAIKMGDIMLADTKSNRPMVNLRMDNRQKTYSVHKLVMRAFEPTDDNSLMVCHKDGNYYNNRLDNLYWGTYSDNASDTIRHGNTTKKKIHGVKLESVMFLKKDMTYDLSVSGPHHNFLCNGFVVHNSVNEYSGRYSIMSNEFYLPNVERIQRQSKDNKQGSDVDDTIDDDTKRVIRSDMYDEQIGVYDNYERYVDDGIARELARINLPVSNYTEWYWKIDLKNLFHFLSLRLDSHAQYEIRVYAEAMYNLIKPIFPITCEAFEDYQLNGSSVSSVERTIISDALSLVDVDKLADESGLSKREKSEFKDKFGML